MAEGLPPHQAVESIIGYEGSIDKSQLFCSAQVVWILSVFSDNAVKIMWPNGPAFTPIMQISLRYQNALLRQIGTLKSEIF